MLLRSSSRSKDLLGGWLAMAAGAWFAIGPTVSLLWHHSGNPIGAPMGGYARQTIEWLGYFQLLGVVIVGLAAFAMGRYYSRPRIVEEVVAGAEDEALLARERAAHDADEPAVAAAGATAAGSTVAAREDRVREDRVGAHEGPIAAHEDRVAAREEPRAVAPSEEPTTVRSADPETIARTEPIAGRNEEPSGASATGAPDEPVATSTGTATYRRRPGLGRFRRGT
jgi:hypothetical protein